MTTSAIKEKFSEINSGLTHLHWMTLNLNDINMNDCGHDWYRASLASMVRSIELLFKSIHDDYYALHELLFAAISDKGTSISGLMLTGENRIFELEEVVTALSVLVAHSGSDDHTMQKCMSAGGSGILARVEALRKHMGSMAKAWRAIDKAAEKPLVDSPASVPKAKPQNIKAHSKVAEAVPA